MTTLLARSQSSLRWLLVLAVITFALNPSVYARSESDFNVSPQGVTENALNAGYRVYALTATGNGLLRFNSGAPETILSASVLTGLQVDETIVGIDFRPATGQLMALGNTGRLYGVDVTTGAATLASTVVSPTLNGTEFGVDFNPVVDRLRVVSNADQNLRVNVDTGATTVDVTLAYSTTDVNTGQNPNVVGAAYTNNFTGTTTTSLYVIDAGLDILATQNPPNNGTLNTVGALGVEITDTVGFDIAPTANAAFAALTVSGISQFYTLNLSTGAATLVGAIGGGQVIRDMAVAPSTELLALTAGNNLVRFDSAAPGAILSAVSISGLESGETVLGIDFRPATGQLYALGSTSRVYTLNPLTGGATLVGTSAFTPTLSGADFGFDFNPTVDRIRVVSDLDQNLRLHPISGTVVTADVPLAYAVGDVNNGQNPNVVGAAYTNNFLGATTTTLYGIDSGLDILVTQNPPNNGTLNTVGALGVDTSNLAGFDIQAGSGMAYAVLTAPSATVSRLYTINLTTGVATLVGTIGGAEVIRGVAVAPVFVTYLPIIFR